MESTQYTSLMITDLQCNGAFIWKEIVGLHFIQILNPHAQSICLSMQDVQDLVTINIMVYLYLSNSSIDTPHNFISQLETTRSNLHGFKNLLFLKDPHGSQAIKVSAL